MGRARHSLLAQLERSFVLLTTGPAPLTADGRVIGHGLPPRLIPLGELRGLLLVGSTSYQARDAAIRLLVTRARDEGDAATIGLVGVLLPGLRAAARPILHACPAHAEDLESEILTGLVSAIRDIDLSYDRLARRIIRLAVTSGRLALDRLIAQERHERLTPLPLTPTTTDGGHPDWLLEEAVGAGTLSEAEAELISQHRINRTRLEELAEGMGVSMAAIVKRRQRAEGALRAWLADRRADPAGAPQRGQGRSAERCPPIRPVRPISR